MENANVHMKRVKSLLPEYGKVGIISITDKQFGEMKLFISRKEEQLPRGGFQLELF